MAWAAGGLALALAVAGCGDDGGGEDDPGGALAGDLTVWIMVPEGTESLDTIDEFARDFEAANEGVTINVDYVTWTAAQDQITTAIAGGQTPDLSEFGNTWTALYAEQGALAPVEAPAGVEFVDGLVDSAVVDGTNYGYPWYAGARALIYRTDVFEDVGVDPPETWQDILTVGDAIAAARDDIAPIHVAGDYQHLNQALIWGAGGEIATEQGDAWTPGFDTDAGREALGFLMQLWEKGWAPEAAATWNSADVRDAFTNGQSAMMIGGGWDVGLIESSNPDLEGNLGTALMPAGPAGSRDVFAGGSHLVVFEESDQQELARAFAEYMIAPEQAGRYAGENGLLPGTVGGVEEAVGGDPVYGVFGEQFVEHSRPYPAAGWWGKVEASGALSNEFQQLLLGEVTVDEAAANLDASIREAIG